MVGLFFSLALGASGDGSVIVGYSRSTNGTEAFRWDSEGGMVGLGDLPGGGFGSIARAVSSDGSVIVGSGNGPNGDDAFRWTSSGGMESLSDLLIAQGEDLSYWSSLNGAYGVSADGNTIVGFGINIDGNFEGFVAKLSSVPEPGSFVLLSIVGVVFFGRRRKQ